MFPVILKEIVSFCIVVMRFFRICKREDFQHGAQKVSGICHDALVQSHILLNMVQERKELLIPPVVVCKPHRMHNGFLDSSNSADIKRRVGHCFKGLYLVVGKPVFMETKILNQGL